MAKKPTKTDPTAPTRQFRVIGPVQGRRRAGLLFGQSPTMLSSGDLTEDQIADLLADPALSVTEEGVSGGLADASPA